jgi:hypothetical protein
MTIRHRFRAMTISVMALALFGCGGKAATPAEAGGKLDAAAAGATGADATGADTTGAKTSAGDDASADGTTLAACPELPAAHAASGAMLTLSIAPLLGGKPFVFGEPNAAPSGATVTPLNFRFFVSSVVLRTAAGASVPADLVTASGALERYGVHLFNAEDRASQTLGVRAAAGSYTGIGFVLGLDEACDRGVPSEQKAPLDDASQMSWTHALGYLFWRFEAQIEAGKNASTDAGRVADAGADADVPAIPSLIHMGGVPGMIFAPQVKVDGALTLGAGGPPIRTLDLDMDAAFRGATTHADTSQLPVFLASPDVIAGEQLRQQLPALPLFVLAP